MMLDFVCYLDGIKHSGSIVRAAHPFPSLSREYKYEQFFSPSVAIASPLACHSRVVSNFSRYKAIDLFDLYVLFSQFRPRDAVQGICLLSFLLFCIHLHGDARE